MSRFFSTRIWSLCLKTLAVGLWLASGWPTCSFCSSSHNLMFTKWIICSSAITIFGLGRPASELLSVYGMHNWELRRSGLTRSDWTASSPVCLLALSPLGTPYSSFLPTSLAFIFIFIFITPKIYIVNELTRGNNWTSPMVRSLKPKHWRHSVANL